MSSPCESCRAESCCRIIPCPASECVDGVWMGLAINGIKEPNLFGLEHPLLNISESCPICGGKGEIIVWCDYYGL